MRTIGHIAFGLSFVIGISSWVMLSLQVHSTTPHPQTMTHLCSTVIFLGIAALIALLMSMGNTKKP